MQGHKNRIAGAVLGTSILFTGSALAADIAAIYEPEPIPEIGVNWYLRGDIGISHQRVHRIDNALYALSSSVDVLEKNFDPSWFVGLGLGYQFSDNFRMDVTGEYRGKSRFRGLDTYVEAGTGAVGANHFRTKKSEATFLVNAYWDITTWNGLTPFVGAGVGASYNKIHALTDDNLGAGGGGGYAKSNGEWNFAWALHAGFGWALTDRMTLEIAYRYLHLGDAESGDIINYSGTNTLVNPLEFDRLASHDIKLGLRYLFW